MVAIEELDEKTGTFTKLSQERKGSVRLLPGWSMAEHNQARPPIKKTKTVANASDNNPDIGLQLGRCARCVDCRIRKSLGCSGVVGPHTKSLGCPGCLRRVCHACRGEGMMHCLCVDCAEDQQVFVAGEKLSFDDIE